jgi:polyisoprenoid-binding protein YceI
MISRLGLPRYILTAAIAGVAAVTLTASGKTVVPAPATYRVTSESRLDVLTGKAGLFGGLGHDHRIRARSFVGTIVHDPASPASSSVEITVQAEDLDVLPIGADRKDGPKVEEAMREDVLHVDNWPTIAFRSRSVTLNGSGVRVHGDLTMAGQTKPVTVDMRLQVGGRRLLATGRFTIVQSNWGIEPYSAALGTIKVADEVTFDLRVIGERTGGA